MQRLLLVRHGPTAASQAHRFAVDEPLTDAGAHDAERLRPLLAGADRVLSSPALRCRETAAAAGAPSPQIEPRIAEGDFGRWAGLTLAEIHARDPGAADAWMTDPAAAPHGGESLLDVLHRVAAWLADATADSTPPDTTPPDTIPPDTTPPDTTTVAFTHDGVIKAAVVTALGAPTSAFWRITAAPLTVTELTWHGDGWQLLRLGAPP